MSGDDARYGWFAYSPPEDGLTFAADLTGSVVGQVFLMRHEHAGPFWHATGPLGDDFEELQARLGITKELYDAAMSWSDAGDAEVEDQLLRRLRAEVHDGIEVAPARVEPVAKVRVRFMVDDCSGIALWDDAVSDAWSPHPSFDEEQLPMSDALRQQIRSWVDVYTACIANAQPPLDHVAHDRAGRALSEQLQVELGERYDVVYHFHTREARVEHDSRPRSTSD